MENNQHTPSSDVEYAVALARLGEQMKHLEKSVTEGFKRLEHRLDADTSRHEDLQMKVAELEKRVDKVYWVWGAAVFLGAPILTIITSIVKAHFGL